MTFLAPAHLKLGIVCLARLTFEHELATQWYQQARAAIKKSVDGVDLYAIEKLIVEPEDASAAIQQLRLDGIDALIVLNGTFALGGLAQSFAQTLAVPMLLWAWPEPSEQTGKLRLNSLVGMHLNASNLYKLGYRPVTLYGAVDSPQTTHTIEQFAKVAGMVRDLRRARIGLIGGHAPGFDNLAINRLRLRQMLGVEVVDISIPTIIAKAKRVSSEHLHMARTEMLEIFNDVAEVTYTQSEQYAALTIGLSELAKAEAFDALALKCWGDLVEQYGIAGCGAAARLNDSGVIVGCEGDVLGAVTMLIAQRLCGTPTFLTDLVSVEREGNSGFCWHIGCAPLCLANPNHPKHLHSHFAGGKGLTASFALKPGRVTIVRLGDDGHNLRMIAANGTALETALDMRGTVSRVKFDQDAGAFLDTLLQQGWEHHVVLAYGEIMPELELLCRALQISFTRM